MSSKDFVFHSDSEYPRITRSGSVPYSGAAFSWANVELASSVSPEEEFLVFKETGGWRSRVPIVRGPSNTGKLVAHIETLSAESGTIYWRIYGY